MILFHEIRHRIVAAFPCSAMYFRSAGEMWRHRLIVRNLVQRDLKIRYKGSVFGFLWALLNPLAIMLIFLFIFSMVPKMQVEHYPYFLLSAILSFGFSSNAINRSATILSDHSPLVKKIYFPREILPLAAVLADFVNFVLAMAVFVIAVIMFIPINPRVLWLLPLLMIWQLLFTLGCAWFIAAANVFLKDTAQILGILLTFWYFLSPVFYPLAIIPEKFHLIYLLNPLAAYIGLYRFLLLSRMEYPVFSLIVAFSMTILFFFGGFRFYKLRENDFVKLL